MTDKTETALERTDRGTRRTELAELKAGPGGNLFAPENYRDLFDMGNALANMGNMISPIYRGSPADCMGLIAVCAPYGLNPVQVSWKTYKASKGPDAPISYEAQVVAAMINNSGKLRGDCLSYAFDGDGGTRRVHVSGTMRDGEVRELTTPMLKDISPKNSPLWKTDPDQQLAYYGARSWARRFMPQMLLGIVTTDEVEDYRGPDRAKDVTPDAPTMRTRGGGGWSLPQQPAQAPEPEPEPEPHAEVLEPAPAAEAPAQPAQRHSRHALAVAKIRAALGAALEPEDVDAAMAEHAAAIAKIEADEPDTADDIRALADERRGALEGV